MPTGSSASFGVRDQILVPPPGRRLDLLDDINPDAGRVEEPKPALAERFIPKREGHLGTLNGSGPGGADGWDGCMKARLALPPAPALSRTNHVASKATSNPNQRR